MIACAGISNTVCVCVRVACVVCTNLFDVALRREVARNPQVIGGEALRGQIVLELGRVEPRHAIGVTAARLQYVHLHAFRYVRLRVESWPMLQQHTIVPAGPLCRYVK